MITGIKILTLVMPLLLSGLSLIVVLKLRLLTQLDISLDGNKKFHNKRIFGDSKTIKGVFVHIFIATFVCELLYIVYANGFHQFIHPLFGNQPIFIGLIYSVFYCLGELVNSFIKRQINISPGGVSASGYIQNFFDLADGIIVVTVVLIIFTQVTFYEGILAAILGIFLHFATDFLMKGLGLKKHSKKKSAYQGNCEVVCSQRRDPFS